MLATVGRQLRICSLEFGVQKQTHHPDFDTNLHYSASLKLLVATQHAFLKKAIILGYLTFYPLPTAVGYSAHPEKEDAQNAKQWNICANTFVYQYSDLHAGTNA